MISPSLSHDKIEGNSHRLLTVELVDQVTYIVIFAADYWADRHQSVELFAKLDAFVSAVVHLASAAKHVEFFSCFGLSHFCHGELVRRGVASHLIDTKWILKVKRECLDLVGELDVKFFVLSFCEFVDPIFKISAGEIFLS